MNGMKISIKIAVTAAALAAAAYAPAQETGRAITLDEAIAVTLTENPAMKAAAYEERAAQQQRRAAIGLRMPQINLTGAYAYLGKDIGFDFNDLKTPVNDLAGKILGSGLIAPELIPSIQGLLNPMMNAVRGGEESVRQSVIGRKDLRFDMSIEVFVVFKRSA